MANIIKIKDLYGDFHYICLDKLVSVSEEAHHLSNGNSVPVWHIILTENSIDVDKNTYSEDAFFAGLRGYDTILYEDYDKRHPKQQEIAPPPFKFPNSLERYDYSFMLTSNPDYSEDEYDVFSFIESGEVCYLVDGDLLTDSAIKIPTRLALYFIATRYKFHGDNRKIYWIEVDGHPAILFHNKVL